MAKVLGLGEMAVMVLGQRDSAWLAGVKTLLCRWWQRTSDGVPEVGGGSWEVGGGRRWEGLEVGGGREVGRWKVGCVRWINRRSGIAGMPGWHAAGDQPVELRLLLFLFLDLQLLRSDSLGLVPNWLALP